MHCKDRVILMACYGSGSAGQGLFASLYRRVIKGTSVLFMCSGPDISCLMRQLFSSISFVESWTRSRAGQPEESCFDSGHGQEISSSTKRPDHMWVLPILLFQKLLAVLFPGLGRPCERYQSPTSRTRSRMSGTMSSHACAWLAERELYIVYFLPCHFYFV
jgi:hypothetical protein